MLTSGGYVETSDSTQALLTTPAYRFFLTDHLGSVRVVADAAGNVLQRNDYLPYGEDYVATYAPGGDILAGLNIPLIIEEEDDDEEEENLEGGNRFGEIDEGDEEDPGDDVVGVIGPEYYRSFNAYRFSGKEQVRGLYDFGARWFTPKRAHWTTMDLLAEKYFSISPYAYCSGNPVNLVDPSGMDIWEVNEQGRIVNHIENTESDSFYMVHKDQDGNYTRTLDENGNEIGISFTYGTVEKIRSIPFSVNKKVDTYDIIQVRGDDKGSDLFEFFAHNITAKGTIDTEGVQHGIEYGLTQTGIEGDKGLNFITTSHTEFNEYGQMYLYNDQLNNGYYLRRIVHSHPNNAKPSNNDMLAFGIMINAQANKGWQAPVTGIYYVGQRDKSKTNTYVFYK